MQHKLHQVLGQQSCCVPGTGVVGLLGKLTAAYCRHSHCSLAGHFQILPGTAETPHVGPQFTISCFIYPVYVLFVCTLRVLKSHLGDKLSKGQDSSPSSSVSKENMVYAPQFYASWT